MTAPETIPGVVRADFQGTVAPPEVQALIVNMLISGAPFSNSLTRQPTTAHSVVFPTASPTGWAWLEELQRLPTIDLGDDAVVVATAKLAGVIDLSNEMVADSAFDLAGALRQLFTDSLSSDLDKGLLYGEGAPEPTGCVAAAPVASGADMLAAIYAAMGSIGDAGGTATTVAVRASMLAEADGARAAEGFDPIGTTTGLDVVAVPTLENGDALVYDRSRCFFVLREPVQVDSSNAFHFDFDALSIRVKARAAVGIPAPHKAIRRLQIGDGDSEDRTRKATPTKATPAKKAS